MTTTETDDDGKVDAIVLSCSECRDTSTLLPSACRLTLFSHGVMVLRFFCLHCKELSSIRLNRVNFAQRLSETGVPTELVKVPAEVEERAAAAEVGGRLTLPLVQYMEVTPLDTLNAMARKELGLR